MLAAELFGDGAAKIGLALVVGVAGAAGAKGALGGLDDGRRRRRVGLAAHERNQLPALGRKLLRFLHDAVDGSGPQTRQARREAQASHFNYPWR